MPTRDTPLASAIRAEAASSARDDATRSFDPEAADAGRALTASTGAPLAALTAAVDAHASVKPLVLVPVPRSAWPAARYVALHVAANLRLRARLPPFGLLIRRTSAGGWAARPDVARACVLAMAAAATRGRSRGARPARERSHSHSQKGGRLLGLGKEDTRVYTLEDLAQAYPDMTALCVARYSRRTGAGGADFCVRGRHGAALVAALAGGSAKRGALGRELRRVAIKDVPDPGETNLECGFHARMHRWFTAAGALHRTALHPTLHYLDASSTPGALAARSSGGRAPAAPAPPAPPALAAPAAPAAPPPRRLIVTRLFDGDVAGLRLAEPDLLDLAAAVLRFLRVLHANAMLHMDIKPTNVLYRRRPGGPGGGYEFVVADYNLLLEAPAVQDLLAPGAPGREFEPLSHGTPGFMSPLLLRDEGDQGLYAHFERVARAIGLRPAGGHAFWRGFFDAQRRGGRVLPAKVDLHSLALTLLRLAEHLHLPAARPASRPSRLTALIGRLMFFAPGDFRDADEALAAL
jgi:hypothetical protein